MMAKAQGAETRLTDVPKLRVLDLFSGLGGFSLGLERTGGFRTTAFCEIEPFCRRVLAKHWPNVRQYDDVRTLTADTLRRDGIGVDVICGGFPCQDISLAGEGKGLAGERSGLWSEIARLSGELRPRFVIVENVAALLGRGLGTVLGDLAALGYRCEWHCIPASALGAHHRRDRVWIVAHSKAFVSEWGRIAWGWRDRSSNGGEALADAASIGHEGPWVLAQWCRPETNGAQEAAHALTGGELGEWSPEPDVGRVANGVPDRVDRLKALGNAVVPQIPELIGHAILAARSAE